MRWTQWPTSAVGTGKILRVEAFRNRLPRRAAIVRYGRPRRRRWRHRDDRDSLRIDQDRVQAQPAGAGRPLGAGAVAAQRRQLGPGGAAVGRLEQRRVLDAGVDRVGVGQRRLEMPDPLEFPRVRRAVVPLVRAGNAVVEELVADRFPRLAAVAAARDGLAEPVARLRGIDAVRIDRRSLQVIDLPAAEERRADRPVPPRAVRFEDECALARADEKPDSAHDVSDQGNPIALSPRLRGRPAAVERSPCFAHVHSLRARSTRAP